MLNSRWTYGVTTVYLDSAAYIGLVDVISEFLPRVKEIQSGTLALMAQPISKSMVQLSRDRGDDPMNVTLREQLCKSFLPFSAVELFLLDTRSCLVILESLFTNIDWYG